MKVMCKLHDLPSRSRPNYIGVVVCERVSRTSASKQITEANVFINLLPTSYF